MLLPLLIPKSNTTRCVWWYCITFILFIPKMIAWYFPCFIYLFIFLIKQNDQRPLFYIKRNQIPWPGLFSLNNNKCIVARRGSSETLGERKEKRRRKKCQEKQSLKLKRGITWVNDALHTYSVPCNNLHNRKSCCCCCRVNDVAWKRCNCRKAPKLLMYMTWRHQASDLIWAACWEGSIVKQTRRCVGKLNRTHIHSLSPLVVALWPVGSIVWKIPSWNIHRGVQKKHTFALEFDAITFSAGGACAQRGAIFHQQE